MQLLLEHSGMPGTTYQDCLIYGGGVGCILNEMDLHEASDNAGCKTVKFKGKFQEANAVNKNKRTYPFEVLNSNVERLNESLKNGGLCGELDHPTDSIVHFANASHKVTKLWWDKNTLMGEGHILNTPCGKILKALINDGVRIGISSRGVGNGKVNESGVLVIGESYRLITFDAVADPSTFEAFQDRVSNKKENAFETTIPHKNEDSEVKNEDSSIDNKVTKELLLAYLGGIVQKEANNIKARLTNG